MPTSARRSAVGALDPHRGHDARDRRGRTTFDGVFPNFTNMIQSSCRTGKGRRPSDQDANSVRTLGPRHHADRAADGRPTASSRRAPSPDPVLIGESSWHGVDIHIALDLSEWRSLESPFASSGISELGRSPRGRSRDARRGAAKLRSSSRGPYVQTFEDEGSPWRICPARGVARRLSGRGGTVGATKETDPSDHDALKGLLDDGDGSAIRRNRDHGEVAVERAAFISWVIEQRRCRPRALRTTARIASTRRRQSKRASATTREVLGVSRHRAAIEAATRRFDREGSSE